MARYTRKFIIDEIQLIAKELGRTPTKEEFIARAESRYAYVKIFNKRYNKLLEAAGLVCNKRIEKRAKNKRTIIKTSYEDVLRKLKATAEANPGQSMDWIVRHSGCSWNTIVNRFGSMQNAAQAIGVTMTRVNAKKGIWRPTKELVEEIRSLAIQYPDIKRPSELLEHGQCTVRTYRNRIGTQDVIQKIINEAREKASIKRIMARHYPIKYKPAPVVIKWARKRVS